VVRACRIDVVVVYKVDRLTRSLADFAKLIEIFGAHATSFVSVTQSLNTTPSIFAAQMISASRADFQRGPTSLLRGFRHVELRF
jgi:DNA invertase Pin-like site-specific DNA recombinase